MNAHHRQDTVPQQPRSQLHIGRGALSPRASQQPALLDVGLIADNVDAVLHVVQGLVEALVHEKGGRTNVVSALHCSISNYMGLLWESSRKLSAIADREEL